MWSPSNLAISYLNSALNLPASGNEQDWEIEMSNPDRISEFLDFYEEHELSQDCQKALMALILASFEDAAWMSKFDEYLWFRTTNILRSNSSQFKEIILIWTSSMNGDHFAISDRLSSLTM